MNKNIFLSGLLFFFVIVFSIEAQVDTISVYSKVMDKNLKAAVVKPDSYNASKNNFPVVYLLHGGSGSFSDWHKKTTEPNLLVDLANQYQTIIVTPGVGPSSYYFDSPIMDSVQYETYMTKELIPHIDQVYKTVKERKGRAITGLSMGGHGAMMLSAKHPDIFIAAGSMSGVMNIDTRLWKVDEDFRKLRREGQQAMLGNIQYDAPFSHYTAVGLVAKMKENDISMMIDCGVDDFLIETNRQMHQLLLANDIPHTYIEKPGAHTWQYWTEALPYHMLFISKVFNSEKH